MAYPPSKNTWVAGERVDAADLNEFAALDTAWGRVASTTLTANSAAFTTLADVSGLSVTFTAIANRYYVARVSSHVLSTVALDRISLTVAEGDDTQLAVGSVTIPGASHSCSIMFETAPHNAGAGSQTYKVRATRAAGTGSCNIQASATAPAVLTVMDVGPV